MAFHREYYEDTRHKILCIQVHASGSISIDGQFIAQKEIKETMDLYPKKDFGFDVKPWCGLVPQKTVEEVITVLKGRGYKVN